VSNIREAGIAWLVWPFMDFYRLVFELALARDSRTREHRADSTAAKLVSAEAIARSLVKIGAYAAYRSRTESELFEQRDKLDENLGIAARIAQGLRPWATSPAFTEEMTDAHIPHPFDSHPPLDERMRGVACVIPPENFAALVTVTPTATWAEEIQDAEALEARLWSGYEKEFARAHEINLAYRYDPTKADERELVLKYFPPEQFKTKKGNIEINCEAIVPPNGEAIVYDAIKEMSFQQPSFRSNYLQVTLHEKGTLTHKKVKISLAGLENEVFFQMILQRYWSRHDAMRACITLDQVIDDLNQEAQEDQGEKLEN
jgi:hypothetical protein